MFGENKLKSQVHVETSAERDTNNLKKKNKTKKTHKHALSKRRNKPFVTSQKDISMCPCGFNLFSLIGDNQLHMVLC